MQVVTLYILARGLILKELGRAREDTMNSSSYMANLHKDGQVSQSHRFLLRRQLEIKI